MRLMSFVLAGLGCLPLLVSAATPDDAAHAFFSARLAADASLGAPGGLELANYSTWLGPELVCLLGAARRYNDAYASAQPDSPPPFAHHDLYSGGETLPSRFSLDPAQMQSGARARVRANFEYDLPDGSTVSRNETLHMAIEKRRWVISDIEYGSPPAFELGKPTLAGGLRAALDHANTSIGWTARQLDGCPVSGELARLKAQQQRRESASTAVSSAKKSAHGTRKAHAGSTAKSKSANKTTPKKKTTASKSTTTRKPATTSRSPSSAPRKPVAKKPATPGKHAHASSSRAR